MIDEGLDGWRRLLNDERMETSAHLEDEYHSKTGVFEMTTQTTTLQEAWDSLQNVPSYCETQAASCATEPAFAVGDTVRILAPDFAGQVGELQVIEPVAFVGDFYGVYLDSIENIGMFGAGEIEKVVA